MKHLLIILSFVLLSSPVIGDNHKGETLYGWITSSSTLEWKGFGDKETHPIYKGDVENGKPSGLGVITFTDGSKIVGEYKDGEKNGQGTFTWSDGKKYVGEYKEDLMNGQGTISWSNMEKFVGEWKDGKQWNGTYYDKEGNIHSKVVNGKGQKYHSLKPTPSSPVTSPTKSSQSDTLHNPPYFL